MSVSLTAQCKGIGLAEKNNHFLPWVFSTTGPVLDPVLCTKASASVMEGAAQAVKPPLPALTSPRYQLG